MNTALFQLQEFSHIEEVTTFPELDFSISLQDVYKGIRLSPTADEEESL